MQIAIVEDNLEAGKYLEKVLTENGHTFVWYTTGAETMENIAKTELPQLILMDINLPDTTGIELTRLIKKLYPQVDILVQTVNEGNDVILNAIKAGASGYILKGSTSTEILSAINLLREGGTFITGKLARRMLTEFEQDNDIPGLDDAETASLTTKEKEILSDIVRRKSYKEIAQHYGITVNTVNTHLKNIYRKLQVRSRTEILNKLGDK